MDRIGVENGHIMQHLQRVKEVGDVWHQIGWVILMIILAFLIIVAFAGTWNMPIEMGILESSSAGEFISCVLTSLAFGGACVGLVFGMIESIEQYHLWSEHTIITDLGNIVLI